MKIKNKLIKKIVINGLIGSLLLNSVPFYSFANNEINTINTNEAGNIKEISPQMIAVLSSLAIGSGITITTNDDIYDLSRMFYDYVQNNKELTWDFVNATFHSSVALANGFVNVKKEFLDITKGFFDNIFNFADEKNLDSIKFNSYNLAERPGYFHLSLNDVNVGNDFIEQVGNVYFRCTYTGTQTKYASKYKVEVSLDGINYVLLSESMSLGRTEKDVCLSTVGNMFMLSSVASATNMSGSLSSYNLDTLFKTVSSVGALPYVPGSYDWDNVENKKEENYVSLPIPSNLSQLVGQTHNDFWNNTDNLINPCTQEIILPEVENPSINIGESVKLQTDANCSIYNAEDLVTKAEESKNQDDINNARNEVNKLPEGQDKQDLQNRLDVITPNITLSSNSVTANLDVYIKSENSLVMTLDSNSITFDGFSSVEDMVKENTVTVTIKSSLPYELNSYLVQEITSLDDEPKTLDKEILNIKANGEDDYNTFNDIGTTPIVLLDNQTPGEVNNHGIDFMLDADVPYENGNYKTVIKFEAKQK